MSYPFSAPHAPAPEGKMWLETPTGKHFSRFIHGLRTVVVDFTKGYKDEHRTSDDKNWQHIKDAPLAEANAVCSQDITMSARASGLNHRPVLDIDVPALLVPSSTPGHSHLYIDHPMTWGAYQTLLEALAAAGILQKGYVGASIRRGGTYLRLPWVRKEEKE